MFFRPLFWMFFILFPFTAHGVLTCEDVFSGTKERVLSEKPSEFGSGVRFEELKELLSEVLPRGTDAEHFVARGEGLMESRVFDRPLQIEVGEGESRILMGDGLQRLHLNGRELESISRERLKDYVRQFLVGHPLHPYSRSDVYENKSFRLKAAQADALNVIEKVKEQGLPSLLVVGPGGVGKTPILLENLRAEIIRRQQDKGFHLVLVNSTLHLRQLEKQLGLLNRQMEPFELTVWGDGDSALSFNVFLNRRAPQVLLSTIASFRKQYYQGDYKELLKRELLSLSIDEVHHAGAKLMRPVLEELTQAGAGFFTLGTTAVPVHREVSLQGLFGNRSYWLNLDKGTYHNMDRPLSEVMTQYEVTVGKGEITPLEHLYFLTPKTFNNPEDLFIINHEQGLGRRVLNPDHYAEVFGLLSKLYSQDNKPSITVSGSIESAEKMAEYLNRSFTNKRFGVVHSKSADRQQVLVDFVKGDVDHLVVVEMLDEAFDMPKLATLIDLTPSASSRQIIQRMARPARLADDKKEVEVVFFIGATEGYLADHLMLLDRLIEGRSSGRALKREPMEGSRLAHRVPEQLIDVDYQELRKTLIEFRDKKFKSAAERLLELDAFILEKNAFNIKMGRLQDGVLPSTGGEEKELSLAIWVSNRKAQMKNKNQEWYSGLSPEAVIAIKRTGQDRVRERRTRQEVAELLNDFILSRKGAERVLPSSSNSASQEERQRAKHLISFRNNPPKGEMWYQGLSPEAIAELKRTGEDQVRKMPKPRTRQEFFNLLNDFILSRMGAEKVLPSFGKSVFPDEKELARDLLTFKRATPEGELWYQGLSPEAIAELKRTGEDQVRKMPKPRTRQEFFNLLNDFILSRKGAERVLPSFRRTVSADEKKLAHDLGALKRATPEGEMWYQGLSPEAIAELKRTGEDQPLERRTRQDLAMLLNEFILSRKGAKSVLPAYSNGAPADERKLAKDLNTFREGTPKGEIWYQVLSPEAIAELKRTGEDQVRKMHKRQEVAELLSDFILSKKGAKKVLPSYRKNAPAEEKKLIQYLSDYKRRTPEGELWYQGLSPEAIAELKRTGEVQARKKRTRQEFSDLLNDFILSRKGAERVLPLNSDKVTADEKKLAQDLGPFKQATPEGELWYQGLSPEAIAELKRTGEDQVRKMPKPRTRHEFFNLLNDFILSRKGAESVLPSQSDKVTADEKKLAQDLSSFKQRTANRELWFEGLSVEAIAELKRTGEDQVRKKRTRQEFSDLLNDFILSRKGAVNVLPSVRKGVSADEKKLAQQLGRLKQATPEGELWYQGLSPEAIAELKRTGEDVNK